MSLTLSNVCYRGLLLVLYKRGTLFGMLQAFLTLLTKCNYLYLLKRENR